MPTTLAGLIMFVILLLPGFAYLTGKERFGTGRSTSAFRETVAVTAASVTSELCVLAVSSPLWLLFVDLNALVFAPGDYWRQDYRLLLGWSLGLLAVATLAAYLATLPRLRNFRVVRWVTGTYPHPSTVSGWWIVFEEFKKGSEVYVGVILDDGSYVHGRLGSFNNASDDTGDRDLVLINAGQSIIYRAPGHDKPQELGCGAVCLSARHIVLVTTAYVEAPVRSPASSEEEGEAAAEAASQE